MQTPQTLLEATHRNPEPIERREKQLPTKVPNERRRKARADIGLEISGAGISLAFVSVNGQGQRVLTTDFAAFEMGFKEWTLESILAPLEQLVDRYRLQGQTVHVALGGDICVTRTFHGISEEVDANCRELCDRSSHFLALGRGAKVHCKAERVVDAKHKRAWVTLAQHSLLEFVSQAVEIAGLRLGRVEHTVTTLCEIAGHCGMDAHRPVLMVLTGSGVADLIITYQGQLMLQYRPSLRKHGDVCRLDMWYDAIHRHLKCLQRFLSSQLPKDSEGLNTVCIPGSHWKPTGNTAARLESMGLSPASLSIEQVCDGLVCEKPSPTNEMMAAVWLSRKMSELEPEVKYSGDLSVSFRQENRICYRGLAKILWPLAASLLIVCGFGLDNMRRKADLSCNERALDDLQSVRLELAQMNSKMAACKEVLEVSRSMRSKLAGPIQEEVLRVVGRALPEGCWLNKVSIESNARISAVGTCYTNDAIYEYVTTLKDCGLLRDANVVSTRSVRLGGGPAFEFDLSGVVSGHLLEQIAADGLQSENL